MRFPEFTDKWKSRKLRDIATFFSGGTPSSQNRSYYGGEIPFIRSGEISSDSTELFLTQAGLNNSSAKMVEVGDLLLALYGATSGEISLCKIKGAINQAILCIRTVEDKTFIKGWWEKHKQSFLQSYLQGGQGNLSADIVKRLPIELPSKAEQTKIARLLSILDERIATQNKIIEDLQKLRVAISSELFCAVSISTERLETFFSKGKAGGTPTSNRKEYYNGGIPFLSINDITKQGKFINSTENYLSNAGVNNSSAWIVPENSLILSMYASVGLAAINRIPLATSQAMFSMILKDICQIDYLYYYLLYFRERYLPSLLETGTQSNINADIVKSIPVPNYGKERNLQIGKTLSAVDTEIENESIVLQHLQMQKTFLLQQMFI